MTKGKIAIITDSSCDIPKSYIEEHHIFVLPLQINMPEGQYFDGVDITPDEVLSRMPNVMPTTSQPSMGYIADIFEQIKNEGYKEAIAVCLSSGLSGTYNVVRLCANEAQNLTVHIFDSHRVSMALGLLVMQAVEMIEKGIPADEILNSLNSSWEKTNGFFCLPTLAYLIKGGRIGKVAGTIGTLLGIVPVISLDKEGGFLTYIKTRSYALSIKKIEEAVRNITKNKISDIAVLQGGALEKAKEVYASLKNIEGLRNIFMCNISPAMAVHSGPGMFGIAYRIIE